MIFVIGLFVFILGLILGEINWWKGSLLVYLLRVGGFFAMVYSIFKFLWIALP